MTLSEELTWRGFVNQTTFKDLKQLDKKKLTFYWGVDPSADSMTVGNFAAAMMVRRFIDHGHKAVLLIGGATGMVGDPDGKKEERQLLTTKQIAKNKAGIAAQYKRVFAGEPFKIVDSLDWFKGMGYLQFLRDIGKHVSMTQMLDREFVQSRIGKGGKGISYAEFSYSLIQGYDYVRLFQKFGTTLQLCGADQWGNCLAGVDLIRRLEGAEAHVFSCPLVVNKTTGVKFGKSEAGAVWLDPTKTSVFDFYQFWFNTGDKDVEDYLKIFTLITKPELAKVMAEFAKDPSKRHAQKVLAYETTKIVHGQKQADEAVKATEALFSGAASASMPTLNVAAGKHDIVEVLVKAGLAKSNSEARRLYDQGGVKLNQERVNTQQVQLKKDDVLQVGKRRFVKIS